jgi:hypothetical protein
VQIARAGVPIYVPYAVWDAFERPADRSRWETLDVPLALLGSALYSLV